LRISKFKTQKGAVKMKRHVFTTVLLVVGLLATVAAWAGPGRGMMGGGMGAMDGTGPIANILSGTPVTINGTVSLLGPYGQGLQVDQNGQKVTVYGIGPAWFWSASNMPALQVGDAVSIDAREVTLWDGSKHLVAMSIVSNGKTLQLRDTTTGLPLWRKAGKGGCPNCASGMPCPNCPAQQPATK
jgi:hypothetical protein